MKKQTHLTTLLIVIVIFVLVGVAAVPIIERTPSGGHAAFQYFIIDLTKVDLSGNELGTWSVTMDGKTQRYPSGKLSLDIEVSAFDDITGITLPKSGVTQIRGELQTHWNGYHYLKCTVAPSAEEYWLAFEDNLDRWALFRSPDEPFYVGSHSGNHTTQELVEFFDLDNWIAD